MTHPDPRTAEIIDRNARAMAEATQAPPHDLPDDPHAYLAWLRDKPPAKPQAREPRQERGYIGPVYHDRRTRATVPPPPEPSPEYAAAAATLARHPDLGAAAIEAARAELGQEATYEQLVLHAAGGTSQVLRES